MVKITDLPVTAPPPEGTLSYEIDGTRYDLCPHTNGEEVVMVTTRAELADADGAPVATVVSTLAVREDA